MQRTFRTENGHILILKDLLPPKDRDKYIRYFTYEIRLKLDQINLKDNLGLPLHNGTYFFSEKYNVREVYQIGTHKDYLFIVGEVNGKLEEFNLENEMSLLFKHTWEEIYDYENNVLEDGSFLETFKFNPSQEYYRFIFKIEKEKVINIDSFFYGDEEDKIIEITSVDNSTEFISIMGVKTKKAKHFNQPAIHN